jgi:diguanylate cyclase (GGDEF)-like protein
MLSVPTLWTVFVVNFLALGLVWAYVVRSYPKFDAAWFWAGSAFAAAVGAGSATLRMIVTDSLLPLLVGGTALIFAACLAAMGIRRFFGEPVSWRGPALTTGLGFASLSFFIVAYDSVTMRVVIYTIAQSVPLALSLRLLFLRHNGRVSPGARLAGVVIVLIIGIYLLRLAAGLMRIGGEFTFMSFNPTQSALVLVLVFLSMTLNFGFLLMAIDRLRNEVADLALLDDLTGAANRRHLAQRLEEECARSQRSGDPFALLLIDLDGFKAVNDTHGHAAGDACLQHFALMAQTRLRPGDLLARNGGDEFCIVLPASTLHEGVAIARRVLEACRLDAAGCVGTEVPIAVSIGVAQWTRDIGPFPELVIGAADQALYAAKKNGKNCYAAYDPSPPLAPESQAAPAPADATPSEPCYFGSLPTVTHDLPQVTNHGAAMEGVGDREDQSG